MSGTADTAPAPFCYLRPVRFSDVDHAGIVYYPRIFHYFHVAFEEFFRDRMGARSYARLLDEDRIGFPSVNAECTYHAPLRFGDTAEIEMTVARIGNRSVTFRFRVFRVDAADEADAATADIDAATAPDYARTLCAEGTNTCAIVDLERFRATALPDHLRALLAPLAAPAAD